MLRYMKLYKIYLQQAIKGRLEYKKDALVGIFSFMLTNLTSFISLMFIVNSIPSLNGWTMYELGFLYGFSMLPRALDHLLTDSLWYIGYWYVRVGEIDRYLVRPVNTLFQVIAEVFQPEAIGEGILGLVLLGVCSTKVDMNITFGSVVLMVVAVIFGAIIFSALKLITCSVAFWTKRSGYFMNMVYNFADFAKYPIGIYHPVLQFILAFILPFGLVISIPVEVLIAGTYNPWLVSVVIIGMAGVLSGIGCFLWNLGIRNYESAGS